MRNKWIMHYILALAGLTILLGLTACDDGETGTLIGRVVDGFGYPLGGDAVMITLSNNPAVTNPNERGDFEVHAPTGSYTMRIAFSNPAAGFDYKIEEQVNIYQGTRNLGAFTLLNVQNMQGWAAYGRKDWTGAVSFFGQQAAMARSGQVVLPYMRYSGGEPNQNTLLTQGVLSAENGLGWTYARGLHDINEAKTHYLSSLAGGYNNLDAKVGLAGIAVGEGQGQAALDYLDAVIDEPGSYDSSQIHDDISETDLIAVKSLAQFLLGYDVPSEDTAASIADTVGAEGNPASSELLSVLQVF